MRADETDRMEERLQAWAHWLTLGRAGSGWSAINPLHQSWSPPTAGTTPTPKASRSDARERAVHGAVVLLSRRLQHTLLVHYCKRMPLADQAAELECAVSTVHQRVRVAKRLIALQLGQA